MLNEVPPIKIEKEVSTSLFVFDEDDPVIHIRYTKKEDSDSEVVERIPEILKVTFKIREDNIELIEYESSGYRKYELEYDVTYSYTENNDLFTDLEYMFDRLISAAENYVEEKIREKYGHVKLMFETALCNPFSIKRFIANTIIWYMRVKNISIDQYGHYKRFNSTNYAYDLLAIGKGLLKHLSTAREESTIRNFGPLKDHTIESITDHVIQEITRWLIYAESIYSRNFTPSFIHIKFSVKFNRVTLNYNTYLELKKAIPPQEFIRLSYFKLLDYINAPDAKVEYEYPGNTLNKICETYKINSTLLTDLIVKYVLGFLSELYLDIGYATLAARKEPWDYSGIFNAGTINGSYIPIGISIDEYSITHCNYDDSAVINEIHK